MQVDWDALVAAAAAARERAYAPYSGFPVGAAVLMEDGSIHTGANVENGIPALAVGAERVAIASAVAGGGRAPRPPPPPVGPLPAAPLRVRPRPADPGRQPGGGARGALSLRPLPRALLARRRRAQAGLKKQTQERPRAPLRSMVRRLLG